MQRQGKAPREHKNNTEHKHSVRKPDTRMKLATLTTRKNRNGFSFLEVMITVFIVGMLAAIAIPNFLRYRESSRRSICIANLKQLQDAKMQWAFEKGKKPAETPAQADLIGPDQYLRAKPLCPAGGEDYMTTIGAVESRAACTRGPIEGHIL